MNRTERAGEKNVGLIYGQQGTLFDTSPKPKKWQVGHSCYTKCRDFIRLFWCGGTYVNPARRIKKCENWEAERKRLKKIRRAIRLAGA